MKSTRPRRTVRSARGRGWRTTTTATPGNAADGSVANELLVEVFAGEAPSAVTAHEGSSEAANEGPAIEIFGDSSYGTASIVEHIEGKGALAHVKVQAPSSRKSMYSKDEFEIDLDAGAVRCPRGVLVVIQPHSDGGGHAHFADHCEDCPLRERCTSAKAGRQVKIHPHERTIANKARSAA